jgi:hypothetical protein
VRLAQAVDDVEDLRDSLFDRERPPLPYQGLQRVAGHQFHDDVRPAGLLVGGEDEDAAGVGDGAGQPALLAEALNCLRGGRELRRDELHGNAAPGGSFLGLVHRTHAAVAQRPPEAIAAHLLGDVGARPGGPGARRQCLGIRRCVGEGLAAIHAEGRAVPAELQDAAAVRASELHGQSRLRTG